MFEVSVTHTFAAAHALRHYKGKCENLHGHNYRVEVTVSGEQVDALTGMLVDFVDLKRAMRQAVDRLDHVNLNETPPFDTLNPSAENIAEYLCRSIQAELPRSAFVARVKVWETDNCAAVYCPTASTAG
jgi:6-pyruvoyltetrahydropterin/6-carboxytetrahydropterin synthase